MVSFHVSPHLTGGAVCPCSCPAAGGGEAGRRRRGREERIAGGGREQEVGGEVLPAVHALLAHALPRRRRPLQALRGTSTSRPHLLVDLSHPGSILVDPKTKMGS